jgi:hypothetical protein
MQTRRNEVRGKSWGRKLFWQAVDHTEQAVLEKRLAEVDQEAKLQTGELQVSQELLAVDRGVLLDGLEFDEHEVIDQEIGTERVVEHNAIPDHRDRNFAMNDVTSLSELML